MRVWWLCLVVSVLTACTTPRMVPIVTYRIETPTKETIVTIDIDANGFVTRRMRDRTDEFQLGPSDFALILDQLRASNMPNMHLEPPTAAEVRTTAIHSIATPSSMIRFVDSRVPESIKPLLVSFQRILRVDVGDATAADTP